MPPGTRVASEAEVGSRFGVGRAAARAALAELERRMLVSRVQGAGTFTRRRIDYLVSPGRAPSWSQTVRRAGGEPETVVLSCDLVVAPAEVCDSLELGSDAQAYRLVRRSFIDEMPAAWGIEWVPPAVVLDLPTALRFEASLDSILRQSTRTDTVRALTRASMESAPEEPARALGCRVGDPVWLIASLIRGGIGGPPVLWAHRWVRADAVRVVLELGTD